MTFDLSALEREMTAWQRDLHAHPEFGFEEKRTGAFVADKLREFGLDEVIEGVGGTGVVGTLKRGSGNRAIALRADMDALRITEQGTRDYRSQNPGTMHACGHDGHTAMLLGAAKLLAEEGGFDGTVRFVFQPAEEWGKGALAIGAPAGQGSRFHWAGHPRACNQCHQVRSPVRRWRPHRRELADRGNRRGPEAQAGMAGKRRPHRGRGTKAARLRL
jgi:hypothetical protein